MSVTDYSIHNEDKFYTIEAEGQETLDLAKAGHDFQEDGYDKDFSGDILRIEDNLAARWSGVRSCKLAERASGAIAETLTNWVRQQVYEHRGLAYRGHGYVGEVVYHWKDCTSGSGKRSCKGWSDFRAYVEFTAR